tara:strand:+ start:259 stop:501 length:243 start_codon:yes stop_codon:yes gene_type:complete
MEGGSLYDLILGLLLMGIGVVLRRFWQLVDQLRTEDMTLHKRITELSISAVSREEVEKAIDRILLRIDKMEERIMNRDGK